MKPKIKFKLIPLENAVTFQILYMDELFRSVKGDVITFKSEKLMNVYSCDSPELLHKGIYLRGCCLADDFNIAIRYFINNEERDKYIDNVLESLNEWANNWSGWNDKKLATSEHYYYEF